MHLVPVPPEAMQAGRAMVRAVDEWPRVGVSRVEERVDEGDIQGDPGDVDPQ